jgi:signal transduction histidine kinase
MSDARSGGRRALQASMLLVLVLITALAYWDEERESNAALEDFAAEQSTLATSLAGGLSVLFEGDSVDLAATQATLLLAARRVERPGESLVLLQPPGSTDFRTTDGRAVTVDALRSAWDEGRTSVRLTRREAAALGLPERMAYAGLADVDAIGSGRWHIVSIATARRERDREVRAKWRLVLGVAVASGLVLAFGGIALINQRKELELQREVAVLAVQNERDERLARATRAAVMGTFAMGIAHEVSTPLGVILGRAEQLLRQVGGDERASHAARVIMDQAERIKLLVHRFLDLARGGTPTLARVDSSSVVRGAIALVDHRFGKGGVELLADVPTRLPAIQCDRALLEHALTNLLLNACEACRPGGTVEVTARADDQQVAFVVADDGEGITPEDAIRATEPFFTTKPEGKGTGLGLAIASEIVASHRGSLSIGPRSPRGTRACIAIPVSPEEVRHGA